MPSFCSVLGCSKRAGRDRLRFFRIPKALKNREKRLEALSNVRRQSWITALKRGNLSETFLKNARICENHFVSGEPAQLEGKDDPDWTPSVNMGYIPTTTQCEQSVTREVGFVQRQTKHLGMDEVDEAECVALNAEPRAGTSTQPNPCKQYDEQQGRQSVMTQTDLDMNHLKRLFDELDVANQKIHSLEEKLKASDVSEESFKDNDSKTLCFTGFPKAEVMFLVFNSVVPYLSTKSVLPPFKQFILTLMKLRLNLPFKYLSHRFAVAPSTVSNIFYKCINVLYSRYKNVIFWPDREILRKTMPRCFKENFDDGIPVLIDCFEIYTEAPSGMFNAAHCRPNYEHLETVKYLIGITPQGTVSYISEAWSGQTTGKFLTENCGFLNLVEPGDVILADRDFLMGDSVETVGGPLEISAFTKGTNGLDLADIEITRKIANVRIHVERVIGLLKREFKIFQDPIPISMLLASRGDLSVLDKVIAVCSVFINLCPSVIPMD